MALERVRDILHQAEAARTAVLAFDAFDYPSIAAVIRGAEAAQRPIIAMLYPAMAKNCPFRVFTETVRTLARQVRVPVGLHLDHCSDYALILAAMRDGFTSVMADGSLWPFEENIRFTQSVMQAAQVFDVDVEAELGHVGQGKNRGDYADTDRYTTPESAQQFTAATGVTALAIAIGSAHGPYQTEPNLDIARLRQIDAATGTPLVLHGGSGIPGDQLHRAFRSGIRKLNIGTELFELHGALTREAAAKADTNSPLFAVADHVEQGLTAYIAEKLTTCT